MEGVGEDEGPAIRPDLDVDLMPVAIDVEV
jgi:hypothetical protein